MPTKIIGFSDRILNVFSKFGRERNQLYGELNHKGYKHIAERNLPNNSRVILAYKNPNSETASYAFKVNPDLTMEQKKIETGYVLNGFGDKNLFIEKIWADKEGNKKAQEVRNIKFRKGKIVGRTNSSISYANAKTKYEGEYVGLLSGMNPDRISEYYKRTNLLKPHDYEFIQYTDGTRKYKKYIDGVECTFNTKH